MALGGKMMGSQKLHKAGRLIFAISAGVAGGMGMSAGYSLMKTGVTNISNGLEEGRIDLKGMAQVLLGSTIACLSGRSMYYNFKGLLSTGEPGSLGCTGLDVGKPKVPDVPEIAGRGNLSPLRGDRITPSLPEGSKPLGNFANETRIGYIGQNEAARLLASKGYRVEMLDEIPNIGNGYGIKPKSNPDFLIEGRVFDCYTPENPNTKPSTIVRKIAEKTTNQAPNIILNKNGYTGDVNEVFDLIKIKATPKGDLKHLQELIVIRNGEIINIF